MEAPSYTKAIYLFTVVHRCTIYFIIYGRS